MCRYCALLVVTTLVALAVSADSQQAAEGQRYGHRLVRHEAVGEGGDGVAGQGGEVEYSLQDNTRSKRTHRQRVQEDDTSEEASSYSSVIMHNKEQTNLQYKNMRGKGVKGRPKTARQNYRESMAPSYKQYKPVRQGDPPPVPLTQSQQQSQVPSEQFVQEVHPSVMQRLMKQQPQTFDAPSSKESEEDFDPTQTNHNGATEESSESNQDISKRPIYVPNRVSVQNPSGDSSFNVGYSIGFGNGFAHRPKSGVVDPPVVSYRQSKGISYPTSFQSTPVNVHIDGKNSVWKNMGSGVEMSHNLDSEPKHVSSFSSANNDYSQYSSGSVVNQPIFFRESFDVPTEGRNTFDHNYALQQSNPFDFSNAIDPDKSVTPSSQQSSDDEEAQYSYGESFPRQAFPSYFEPYPKPTHPSHLGPFMKPSHPSYVDLPQQRERGHQPTHSVSVASSGERLNYDGYKFDSPSFERPSFVPNRMGPFRISHPVTLVGKPKPIDFYKYSPNNGKQAYNIKPFLSNDFHSNSADLQGNNFEFSSVPMPQQLYDPSAKAAPIRMVQAILVPVNTPIPSYSHQPGVPVVGNGYSPFLGQPIGYVNVPQDVDENSPLSKQEFEHSDFEQDGPSEAQELSPYFKKPPVKMIRSHYSGKHPKMETKYQLQRPAQPRLRTDDQQDIRHSMKYKRVFSTESPDLPALAEMKPQTSADMSVSTSHPPRLYRSRPVLLVKRS